jgi:hypothetical protein
MGMRSALPTCLTERTASGGSLWPRRSAAWLILLSVWAGGCNGSARFDLIPLGLQRIQAQAPLIYTLRAAECYFWIDSGDQLCIACADESGPWFGKGAGMSLRVSLVLDGLPAHVARDYRATRRTLRGRASQRGRHARFASTGGIVAVWVDDEDRIHGRFRVLTRYQTFNVLLGWTGTQQVLLLGEFRAVRDRERGEPILARTEEEGMERQPATSQPARRQPIRVTGPPPAKP